MRNLLTNAAIVVCALGLLTTTGCKASLKVNTGDDKVAKPAPPPPPPKAAPAPAPKKSRFGNRKAKEPQVNSRGEVQLPGPVLFQTGTANLQPASDVVLSIVHAYLEAKPNVTKLRIEGHTDTDDANAKNMQLSKNRAMAVTGWLIAKGIDCKRLVPVGFGEEKLLVSPESSPEDKAQNRRVMFVNAEINGKALGGRPIDGGAPGQIAGEACK